jgi:hypothetical protein
MRAEEERGQRRPERQTTTGVLSVEPEHDRHAAAAM